MKKVLVLVKKNNDYGDYSDPSKKSKAGLYNSARLLVDALNKIHHIHAILDTCIDSNVIDKKLFHFKPNLCVLEAIWVTPTKLKELVVLHPKVKFCVRIHSKAPFLAMEGQALSWIKEYEKIPHVQVAFNNKQTSRDFNAIGISNIYLPNIYTHIHADHLSIVEIILNLLFKNNKHRNRFHIGSFGAIRPLKCQLTQAMAAIEFANKKNAKLSFYINAGRTEQYGENVLKNLRALFSGTQHHLVEMPWLTHEEFLKIVATMDICMQVSYTESFNIVAADCVLMKKPIVVSKEIDWIKVGIADPNNVHSMVCTLEDVWANKRSYTNHNLLSLKHYNEDAIEVWENYLSHIFKHC